MLEPAASARIPQVGVTLFVGIKAWTVASKKQRPVLRAAWLRMVGADLAQS